VNVQTTNQPVLVVPLNVAQQQAPPAEYLGQSVPGAPATFAVDTGERAMNATGFQPQNNSGRNRSRTPRASNAPQQSNQIDANTNPSTKLNVIKQA
jgi:hypothetical protein